MDAITENSIRQEQIESFGRLMAGFSHDMKNHLGIIRESNGLMGDIIEMAGQCEDEQMQERLKKSIASIERRVVIAANMFHHLSGLAHRPDTPCSYFQINELLEEECVFLERYSRLKQVDLVLDLGEGIGAVYNDPSMLQHVLYRLYTRCIELLSAGHRLVIETGEEEKAVVVIFGLSGASLTNLEQVADTGLLAAVEKLEGTVEICDTQKEHVSIRLILPSLSQENSQ